MTRLQIANFREKYFGSVVNRAWSVWNFRQCQRLEEATGARLQEGRGGGGGGGGGAFLDMVGNSGAHLNAVLVCVVLICGTFVSSFKALISHITAHIRHAD